MVSLSTAQLLQYHDLLNGTSVPPLAPRLHSPSLGLVSRHNFPTTPRRHLSQDWGIEVWKIHDVPFNLLQGLWSIIVQTLMIVLIDPCLFCLFLSGGETSTANSRIFSVVLIAHPAANLSGPVPCINTPPRR